MRRFRVLRDEMLGASSELNSYGIKTNRIAEESLMIAREMRSSNQSYSEVASVIYSVGNEALRESDCIRALSKGLESVAQSYEITENKVAK